ncbi:hypothetical protein ACWCQK_38280 [Streptomyces sp. NPDC002306]
MSDTEIPAPGPTRTQPDLGVIVTTAVVIVLVAGGAFWAGRATAPESSTGATNCVSVEAAADRLIQENTDAAADEAQDVKTQLGRVSKVDHRRRLTSRIAFFGKLIRGGDPSDQRGFGSRPVSPA